MKIAEIIKVLEDVAPQGYQESYDNAGLITGESDWECTGITVALDATEEVVLEAVKRGHNLIVAHHPIVFSGLKKLNGKNYVERTVIRAIKNDIAIYAIHTNLDNVVAGVNGRLADALQLSKISVLKARAGTLKKLVCFVPLADAERVSDAVFAAGAGSIGKYSECAFRAEGTGSFKAGAGSQPFVGEIGKRHHEREYRLEVVFEAVNESAVVSAMIAHHPYEEVAYDVYSLSNVTGSLGSGLLGVLSEPMETHAFMRHLKDLLRVPVIRHSKLVKSSIQHVAICGGAGSFLIFNALRSGADIYITADLKYHEFFDANDSLILADPGHFETEQFTIDLLYDLLAEKFPTFAVFKTDVKTNPVNYYI